MSSACWLQLIAASAAPRGTCAGPQVAEDHRFPDPVLIPAADVQRPLETGDRLARVAVTVVEQTEVVQGPGLPVIVAQLSKGDHAVLGA